MTNYLLQLDHQIVIWFNGLRSSWLDYLLGWPTYLGATWLLLIVIFVLMYLWDRRNVLRKYSFMLLVMLLSDVIIHILKYWIQRPRPFVALKDTTPLSVLFSEPASYSFPSGHSAIIFCAAVLVNSLYQHRFTFLYGIAVLVCITRMYVGVHYLSDVIAGGFLGAMIALSAVRILKKFAPSAFKSIAKRNNLQ